MRKSLIKSGVISPPKTQPSTWSKITKNPIKRKPTLEECLDDIKKSFHEIDIDHSGDIDKYELLKAMSRSYKQ